MCHVKPASHAHTLPFCSLCEAEQSVCIFKAVSVMSIFDDSYILKLFYLFFTMFSGAEQNSFRSIKEAVAAAQDGDQVVLLPGIHNGMG